MKNRRKRGMHRTERLPDEREEMRRLTEEMERIRREFARTRDEDLMEACAYELKALEARCRCLLRMMREQDASRETKDEPIRIFGTDR